MLADRLSGGTFPNLTGGFPCMSMTIMCFDRWQGRGKQPRVLKGGMQMKQQF